MLGSYTIIIYLGLSAYFNFNRNRFLIQISRKISRQYFLPDPSRHRNNLLCLMSYCHLVFFQWFYVSSNLFFNLLCFYVQSSCSLRTLRHVKIIRDNNTFCIKILISHLLNYTNIFSLYTSKKLVSGPYFKMVICLIELQFVRLVCLVSTALRHVTNVTTLIIWTAVCVIV